MNDNRPRWTLNPWQKQYHNQKYDPLIPDPRPLGVRQNEEAIAGGMIVAGLIACGLIVICIVVVCALVFF